MQKTNPSKSYTAQSPSVKQISQFIHEPSFCAFLSFHIYILALCHCWRMLIRLKWKRPMSFLLEKGQYPLNAAKICTKSFKTQKTLLVVAGLQTRMRRTTVLWMY